VAGLGVYAATKAALERMVESWRWNTARCDSAIRGEARDRRRVRTDGDRPGVRPRDYGHAHADVERDGPLRPNLVRSDDITGALTAILTIEAVIPYLVILPPS
jgi:hypothetical protein